LKFELDLLPTAQYQKDSILEFIVQEYEMPMAAARLESDFNKGFRKIKRQPYICPVVQFNNPKKHEYRKLIVRDYIALYWIDEDNRLVTVSRIFHGKQDYENKI
jgi:plasmid stabilization system protein ParE